MYVDAIQDKDIIKVIERDNGRRVYREYAADYHMYVNDPKGVNKTIYGDPVKRLNPKTSQEKKKLINSYAWDKLWEADINPVARCLEQEYLKREFPKLHTAFFDIETGFDMTYGYSTPGDALNPIISVAIYMQWMEQMVCLAMPPAGMSVSEAESIAKEVGDCLIVPNEGDMLSMFLTLIEDADVISGWNSEFFDIPFTINRVIKLLGKHEAKRFCLWDKAPRKRMIDRGGKEEPTYDISGRVHLDYMQLYKKYNYEERHSYSLDNIAKEELNSSKTPYDGTLDQLYKNDFKLFLEYNIQDTKLLDDLDKKLQFIDLASAIAHGNAVLIPSTMGAVATTEQACVCEAHSHGLVVHNKQKNRRREPDEEDLISAKAAGGWVSNPKKGLHKWVGSSDLNSLYPSVIRAFNMSPETLVGQVRMHQTDAEIELWCAKKGVKHSFAAWWNDRFCTLEMDNFFHGKELNKTDKLFLDMKNGDTYQVTTAELHALIYDSGKPWCITANGTIFRTDEQGVLPKLLERWYVERQQMQRTKGGYSDLITNDKGEGIELDESLFTKDASIPHENPFDINTAFDAGKMKKFIESGDVVEISYYMNQHNLDVVSGFIRATDQIQTKETVMYWDKRQLVRKINLNSVYGGLLNEHHRFFDKRLGQSTTLTGRCITRHMTAKTNEVFTGEYDYNGDCIIYNDTDSVYFSAYPVLKDEIEQGRLKWSKEKAIALYDDVSDVVSDSFPQWVVETFNAPLENGMIIKAGREIVAQTGLFIKKKRYAALVIDVEGKRQDVGGKNGKIKAMGLDLRRADTPKYVQEFLMKVLIMVLDDKGEAEVIPIIRDFKAEFNELDPWQRGIPKGVNKLTHYKDLVAGEARASDEGRSATKGFTVPGHVRGALNWNELLSAKNDLHTTKILDGSKIILCYLKDTGDNVLTNLAYPVDELKLPGWFTKLPFDTEKMEDVVVNNKVRNLLGVLNWDLSRTSKEAEHMENLFDFGAL